jgi:hypothetical protein
MPSRTGPPRVSLVLEHVNAVHVSNERIGRVVRELARQLGALPVAVEVLVPEGSGIDSDAFAGVEVRAFDATGAGYYEVKNAGARAAAADLIVFADCDVMPEPEWLASLLRPFDDPSVDAVVGTTVIRPVSSVTEKVFAAASWFPAHDRDARRQILANNVAVRSEAFLPEGFPPVGCRYRGAEADLQRAWERQGRKVVFTAEARSDHLPPEHPVRRALWDGHDQQIGLRAAGGRFLPTLARVVGHQLVVGSWRVVQNRRPVGLRPTQLPWALVLNAREALARGVGVTLARFAHETMHRRVPT